MPEGPEMSRVKQNDIDWYSNSSTRRITSAGNWKDMERQTGDLSMCQPTGRRYQRTWVQTLEFAAQRQAECHGQLETPELVTAAVYRKRQENMVQINSNHTFHCPSCPSCPCLSMDFKIFQAFLCYQNGHPEAIGFLVGLQQHDLFAATAQFLRNFPPFFPPVPSTAVK